MRERSPDFLARADRQRLSRGGPRSSGIRPLSLQASHVDRAREKVGDPTGKRAISMRRVGPWV